MSDLAEFINVAEVGNAEEMFARLDLILQRTVGARIFSCSIFDPATRQARRVYTNQPDAYPVSGLKQISPGSWTEQVLDRGEIFVAGSISEIAAVFPDHELIAELGCGSAVNMPIKLSGSILGTINLLDKSGHYTPDSIEQIVRMKPAAMIAFAALHRSSSI